MQVTRTTTSISDEKNDNLLSKILKTRIQRRAKNILRLLGINYLISHGVILLSSSDIVAIGNPDDKMNIVMAMRSPASAAFGNVIGLSVLYVTLLGMFLFIHSMPFPLKNTYTTHAIEDIWSNEQLGFDVKFKGKYWPLSYVGICVIINIPGSSIIFGGRNNDSGTCVAAMLF